MIERLKKFWYRLIGRRHIPFAARWLLTRSWWFGSWQLVDKGE